VWVTDYATRFFRPVWWAKALNTPTNSQKKYRENASENENTVDM
jgi:hypothetical protein